MAARVKAKEEHAQLSPSGAVKWMNCAGSLAMEYGIADEASEYASEGTGAHAVAAYCQEKGIRVDCLIDFDFDYVDHGVAKKLVVTQEMADYLQGYIDAVKLIAGSGSSIYVEQRLEFSQFVGIPDQFGTSDVVALVPKKRELQVHDLKYGRGVKVEAEKNSQLMIYALGAYLKYADWDNSNESAYPDEYDTVRLVIHQPRLEHISEWTISVDDLITWGYAMGESARKAMLIYDVGASESDLTPGADQCRFCRAKGTCKVLARSTWEIVGGDFKDLETPPSIVHISDGTLSDDQVGALHKHVDMINMWVIAIKQQLYQRLIAEKDVPGYKLVMGKYGNREWRDADTAAGIMSAWLSDDGEADHLIYKKSLISPTEAEKNFARRFPVMWEKLTKEVFRSPPSLTVAEENDKRSAAGRKAALDDFEAYADEEPKRKRKTLVRDWAKNTAIDDFTNFEEDLF